MTNSSNTQNNPQRPTLHRSGHERVFAGVAGGLGEHLGISPWWFRWAFIFLALFAGVGLFVYLLAWIAIPGPDDDEPIVSRWLASVDWSDGGAVFGVVLVGVAGVVLATRVVHISGTLILAAVMFVVGLLLYRGDLRVPGRRGGAAPPPSDGPARSDGTDESQAMESTPDGAVLATRVALQSPRPPKPPRERSILGRLTIAVGLIVVASMALVEVSNLAVDIQPFHYFAAIIAVLGAGLLIGAWAGRARWLIIIGILIMPLLWISMLLPTSWDFSVGTFEHTPTTVEDVGPYEQGIGQMTIDLAGLSSAELAEIGTIRASLGLGEMVVKVPEDVGVVLRAAVGAGEVLGPFDTVDGVGVNITREFGPGPRVLVLDLEVGAGVIHVAGPDAFRSNDDHTIERGNS